MVRGEQCASFLSLCPRAVLRKKPSLANCPGPRPERSKSSGFCAGMLFLDFFTVFVWKQINNCWFGVFFLPFWKRKRSISPQKGKRVEREIVSFLNTFYHLYFQIKKDKTSLETQVSYFDVLAANPDFVKSFWETNCILGPQTAHSSLYMSVQIWILFLMGAAPYLQHRHSLKLPT